jgi:hypothetical protein
MDKFSIRKNKNRRGSFRIDDEVNLSYKKIDEKWMSEHQYPTSNDHSFSTENHTVVLDSADLLDMPFNRHESHNVNISSSGMAFSCEDALKEGDFLIIKLQLSSSMEAIVTYSQVVYCKDLEPDPGPNDSPHPCFVGTHFVNMKNEDRALLVKHVDEKRKQQHWINGIIITAILAVIFFPDVVFHLLAVIAHFLLDVSLHILHLSFEFIEMNLDHLVEHLFHTDLHQTQVIVFYIILSFVLLALYLVWRALPALWRRLKNALSLAVAFRKANWQFFWQEQSMLNKVKIVSITVAVLLLYFFFGM